MTLTDIRDKQFARGQASRGNLYAVHLRATNSHRQVIPGKLLGYVIANATCWLPNWNQRLYLDRLTYDDYRYHRICYNPNGRGVMQQRHKRRRRISR